METDTSRQRLNSPVMIVCLMNMMSMRIKIIAGSLNGIRRARSGVIRCISGWVAMRLRAKLTGVTWLVLPVAVMGTYPAAAVDSLNSDQGEAIRPFSTDGLDDWSERSFEGNTEYRLVTDSGTSVLRAHTVGKASILYRKQSVDLSRTPVVEWSWKVDRVYASIDELSREGDDFPARLYVVAKAGLMPWDTLAINYVWASGRPLGDSWLNPFTDQACMVAVESGDAHVGMWKHQRRNVAEDFRTCFDRDIAKLSGYAVMVDGDNASREATAWFGQVQFTEP